MRWRNALSTNCLAKNLAALEKAGSPAAAAIARCDRAPVRVFPARDGHPSAILTREQNEYPLHSAYAPVAEAARQANATPLAGRTAFVLLGFGLGYLYRELAKRCEKGAIFYAVEAEPAALHAALSAFDFSAQIASGRLHFILGPDSDRAHLELAGHLSELVLAAPLIVRQANCCRPAPQFYDRCGRAVADLMHLGATDLTTKVKLARLFQRNLFANLRLFAQAAPVAALFGRFAGIPAVIVSAGPSLDEAIEPVKEAAAGALILAVDAALPPLVEAGLTPHMIVSVDPHEVNVAHFHRGFPDESFLLTYPAANPEIFGWFAGRAFACDMDLPLPEHLRAYTGKKGSVDAGLCVAHLAFCAAVAFGCDPIVLVGQDLAFPGEQTHAAGTNVPWGGAVESLGAGLIEVPCNAGGTVRTHSTFKSFITVFEQRITASGARVINTARTGAVIRGCELASPEEALGSLAKVQDATDGLRTVYEQYSGQLHEDFYAEADRLTAELTVAMKQCTEALTSIDQGRCHEAEDVKRINQLAVRVNERRELMLLLEQMMLPVRVWLSRTASEPTPDERLLRGKVFFECAHSAAQALLEDLQSVPPA